ncbi:hypothetical protein MNB_SV-12-1777 [hydrothermal vent metagenome]|uniref:Uncharacterized protein n=1 Tax=hydrothermal vent metagenome TaxID=652676 RepID=A0A1W1BJ71_9ZZZZ
MPLHLFNIYFFYTHHRDIITKVGTKILKIKLYFKICVHI